MNLPTVSFIIPTYNEEKRLVRCLDAIKLQDYPAHTIEIVIADGGSTDTTIAIARQSSAKVYKNKLKLAESGVYLASQKAKGEICIVLAADNVLPHKNWLKRMITPFIEDHEIIASFTHIVPAADDSLFSQYFALLHADPVNEFVYGKAVNPQLFQEIYSVRIKKREYIVYDYTDDNAPLIAMAQGFAFRRSWKRTKEEQYDDILPVMNLVAERKKIAYVPQAGILHYSFSGFPDFVRKYDHRLHNAFTRGFVKRSKQFTSIRKFKQYLFLLYGSSFILPTIVALFRIIRERKIAYIYHPFACFMMVILIVKNRLVASINLYQRSI